MPRQQVDKSPWYAILLFYSFIFLLLLSFEIATLSLQ